ncbi:NACHT, LRR and PYD domains-containing protein 3-like [Engraulis encrasicolus]|uniref:NACHT, LRR and PYD domains-containing protein 3-like n=1 Tax=Engraulis encrasicolus TaxID=184585 RepID=UPI002FCF2C1C
MEMQQAHKSHLLERSKCLMEGLPHQGSSTLLRKIYTDLYITEGGECGVNEEHEVRQIERASWREEDEDGDSDDLEGEDEDLYITAGWGGYVNNEHEVRQIERASWREALQDRLIKCSDIIKHISEKVSQLSKQVKPSSKQAKQMSKQVKPIGIVLTKGVAGIGKTVSVQKFILDWAEGTSNQDVDFIFPLPFRELNLMKEKIISLVDLIRHFFSDVKDPRFVTSLENRVMFIFDGLDECRLPLDFHSNPECSDVTKSVPVDVLLTNLIQGNMLPFALLWITTRPAAANQIPPRCVNQVTEIRGFNDPQKEEYFRKKLSDESLASRIIAHLKSCRSLYIMCHIPVFSWILATVVERTSDGSGSVEMPRTLTQMAATLHDLLKTAVDLALQSKNGHLDLFLRFLLGLSLDSNQSLLRELLPQTNSRSQSSDQTVQLVKQEIRGHRETDRSVNLFYCLNELNQHAVVEHIDRSSGTLTIEMLLPGQWKTEKFTFKTSTEYLDGFDLQKYIQTPEMDQTDLLSPDDVIQKLIPSDVFTSSTSAE